MKFQSERLNDSNIGQTGALTSSDMGNFDRHSTYAKWTDLVADDATFTEGVQEVTEITCIAEEGALAVQTLTFPAKSSITSGDFIYFEASDGTKYAVAADLTGSDAEPTSALWNSFPAAQKAQADLSAATTAAQVAAAFETAIDGITDLSTKITSDDTAADGTMTLTQVDTGPVNSPQYSNAAGTGAGSLRAVSTTTGVASTLNNTSFTIYNGETAYVVKFNVKSEGDDDGDINVAINLGDTDADVATALAAALDGEADFAASATDEVVTCTAADKVDSADVEDIDSGLGFSVETQGITGIDLDEDSVYMADHGYVTGTVGRLTTTDADLPDGLATATDYYLIVVDDNNVKFASSLNDANDGTAVDIIDVGTGTHTFTPKALNTASIKLQYSVDGENWEDVSGSSTNITADGDVTWEDDSANYAYIRPYVTLTAGYFNLEVTINKKRN
jgi:hypothetical protein